MSEYVYVRGAVVRPADSRQQAESMAANGRGQVYVRVDVPIAQHNPDGWPHPHGGLEAGTLKIEVRRVCPECGARAVTERRGDRDYFPCCGFAGVL